MTVTLQEGAVRWFLRASTLQECDIVAGGFFVSTTTDPRSTMGKELAILEELGYLRKKPLAEHLKGMARLNRTWVFTKKGAERFKLGEL